MKKIRIYHLLALIIILAAGCTKETDFLADRSFIEDNGSLLKINYLSAYPANPSVQLSINGVRVSGLITGRTPFPGGGFNTNGSSFPDYLALKPGANTLTIAIPKKNTNVDSVLLYTVSFDLVKNRFQTLHVTDTGSKTKSLLLDDEIGFSGSGSKYRFVNMMPNVAKVDLYFGTTLMQTGIPYLGSSSYFEMAVPPASQAWTIRETGTSPTSTALATYTSANTYIIGRVYTTFASGYKGQTATATRPYISFLLNK